MAVFQYRMPAGIPGAVNRASTATIEPQQLDVINYPTAFGVPVAIDATSHNTRKIMAGDSAVSVYGMYVRSYPTNNNQDGLGTSTPPTSGLCSVLKRGYISVKLNVGPAVKDGTVYVRLTPNGANTIIGGIEAVADGSNTIALPSNCYFTGPADSNGQCELAFNI